MTLDDADKIYLSHQKNPEEWHAERRNGLEAVMNAICAEKEAVPLGWYIQVSERAAMSSIDLGIAEKQIEELKEEVARYYRGENEVQCTCAPPHKYQMREGRCPHYTLQIVALLREIRATGFIINTAHKIRAKIDALLI